MAGRNRYRPAAASPAEFLHVSGVGLRVEDVPAGPLWDRVQRRARPDEEAPRPPGSLGECRDRAGLFRSAALRAALTHRPRKGERGRFTENYPLPTMMALPPATQLDAAALEEWTRTYQSSRSRDGVPWQLTDGPAGMAFHRLGVKGAPVFEAAGVDLWRRGFHAFDTQGDLNSLLLWAEDGYAVRSALGGWESPQGQDNEPLQDILRRPKRAGQLRDVFSGLLLRRPEAAEWLREWALHVRDASQDRQFPNGVVARGPHGYGGLNAHAYDGVVGYRQTIGNFSPTPNVPELWSMPQYQQYAQMPTLAFLSRPAFSAFDAAMSTAQRAGVLEAALKRLLEGPLRNWYPKRIFHCARAGSDDTGLLAGCLARIPQTSMLQGADADFRLERCLGGDLGAGSMNAAIGLAAIAVWETSEAALAVNLRDPRGVLIFGLLPLSAQSRAQQKVRPYVI